jgi:hypothetical protein
VRLQEFKDFLMRKILQLRASEVLKGIDEANFPEDRVESPQAFPRLPEEREGWLKEFSGLPKARTKSPKWFPRLPKERGGWLKDFLKSPDVWEDLPQALGGCPKKRTNRESVFSQGLKVDC